MPDQMGENFGIRFRVKLVFLGQELVSQQLKIFEGNIKQAESDVEQQRDRAAWAQRMVKKGYQTVSQAQAGCDVIAPSPRITPQVPRGSTGVIAGAMIGTARYACPEQARGEPVDGKGRTLRA